MSTAEKKTSYPDKIEKNQALQTGDFIRRLVKKMSGTDGLQTFTYLHFLYTCYIYVPMSCCSNVLVVFKLLPNTIYNKSGVTLNYRCNIGNLNYTKKLPR